ncbi:MAG: DinB family protein [Thermoanaerobaculia bacterium]
MKNELETFLEIWERESAKTKSLLESLPPDAYDFRPDPEGRSLGEMAWHVAEPEAHGSLSIERGGFARENRPPGIERPRTIGELAPAYERLHRDALERLRKLTMNELESTITFFNGRPMTVRDVLWDFMLLHAIPSSRPAHPVVQRSRRQAGSHVRRGSGDNASAQEVSAA